MLEGLGKCSKSTPEPLNQKNEKDTLCSFRISCRGSQISQTQTVVKLTGLAFYRFCSCSSSYPFGTTSSDVSFSDPLLKLEKEASHACIS